MTFATRPSAGAPALLRADGPAAGPHLLLLHGVTRCWKDWQPLLPALVATWHVIAVDHRGHGGSARAGRYLVTDYVADTIRFVRDEVATPLVILGHSLGGMVAAAVAAELPDLVRGVVLEDPPFHTMGERIAGTAWQAQFLGMREAARAGDDVEKLAAALAEIRLPAAGGGVRRLGDLRDAAAIRWSAECLAHLDPEVLTPVIEGRWLDGYDPGGIAARIGCPVLLLQADPTAGGALDDAASAAFAARAARCRTERFVGRGHLLHWLEPAAIADLVNRFGAAIRA